MILPDQPRRFPTTRWSLVSAAGSGSLEGQSALAHLSRLYWYPLYAFVRRSGHTASDAQDLTQDFFALLLERGDIGGVRQDRGRFRSFLLACLRHFLTNEWKRRTAEKNGGATPLVSIDYRDAESRYARELSHHLTPEAIYLRRWALASVEQAVNLLRGECVAGEKEALFDALKPALVGEMSEGDYARLAPGLAPTPSALKVAAHRLRERFREILRRLIADTVDPHDPEEQDPVGDELKVLLQSLG